MKTKLFDPKLNVKDYSWKIGRCLQKVNLSDLPGFDDSVKTYTQAFYNGRERGIALTLQSMSNSRRVYIIVFGECRNSDSIFIDHWTMDGGLGPYNGPIVSDFPESAYEQRLYVSPVGAGLNMFQVAADKIVDLIKVWLKAKK